jgi:hypothetical protein
MRLAGLCNLFPILVTVRLGIGVVTRLALSVVVGTAPSVICGQCNTAILTIIHDSSIMTVYVN